MKYLTVLLLFFALPTVAQLETRFQPDSVVYVYETAGAISTKNFYSAVIQNMAIVNQSRRPMIVDGVVVRAYRNGLELQSKSIAKQELTANAPQFHMLQKAGLLKLYDFQFQTEQYLPSVQFTASDTLKYNEALVITHQAFLFEVLPDELRITSEAHDAQGKVVRATKTLRVENRQSLNAYTFPLRGHWTTAAAPSFNSHHRWASIQEFAYDFIQVGTDNLSYRNEGLHFSDYYAYGEPVFSIGKGTVVSVLDSLSEDESQMMQKGEDKVAYLKRVAAKQQELLSRGFKFVLGNHVVIRHANGEYSFYVHLKPGSIRVKKNQLVEAGTEIAAVGSSGNSTEPHLHFHVTNGLSFVASRSLPVVFSNIVLLPDDNGGIKHLHAGQIVRAR